MQSYIFFLTYEKFYFPFYKQYIYIILSPTLVLAGFSFLFQHFTNCNLAMLGDEKLPRGFSFCAGTSF